MPVLLSVNELRAGMSLARNVVNQYSVLLPHGRRLTDNDIQSLRRRFKHLSVAITDPLLDEAVDFEDDSKSVEISREVRKNVSKVTEKVSSLVRSRVSLSSEHLDGMKSIVSDMLQYIQSNPVTVAIVEQSAGWDDYLQEHCGNVFYLSILMGNAIRNYIKGERERLSAAKRIHNAMNLTPLATAAMFHDLSMAQHQYLYQKTEPLTDEEIKLIRSHPVATADMLPDSIGAMVPLIIRQHHENFNGTGYPNGIQGSKINIFARILRIADAYSAAIAQQTYSTAKSPVTALYEMVYGSYRHLYDPVVLKVFSSLVKPLPIGAKLKLSDGCWGIVVKHNHERPFDPYIIVAFDALGDPLSKEELTAPFRLSKREDLNAVSFGGEDISYLNDLSESDQDAPDVSSETQKDCHVLELTYP